SWYFVMLRCAHRGTSRRIIQVAGAANATRILQRDLNLAVVAERHGVTSQRMPSERLAFRPVEVQGRAVVEVHERAPVLTEGPVVPGEARDTQVEAIATAAGEVA